MHKVFELIQEGLITTLLRNDYCDEPLCTRIEDCLEPAKSAWFTSSVYNLLCRICNTFIYMSYIAILTLMVLKCDL